MTTLLQLNPPLPFVTEGGEKLTAYLALDYGVDYATLFLCGNHSTRELWWVAQSDLRVVDNISLGRPPS